jgi:hypothetical protein
MRSAKHFSIAILVASVALPAAFLAFSSGAEQEKTQPKKPEAWRTLIGSWHVTSGQKSLVISIEPDGKALVLSMQPGQHSIDRVSWESFHGGILLNDMPRKRLWLGRHAQELRAEIEPIPELGYDPNKEFHQRFFMTRVNERTMPSGARGRAVPPKWLQEKVDDGWDAKAGK